MILGHKNNASNEGDCSELSFVLMNFKIHAAISPYSSFSLIHVSTGENYHEEMLSKVVKFLVGMAIKVLQEAASRSEKSIARRLPRSPLPLSRV